MKERFSIEYIFDKASKYSLWSHLSTPNGLAEWFADEVSNEGKFYTFTWEKSSEEAELLALTAYSFIRFKWLNEIDPHIYFEFRLHFNELTGTIILEIIDFALEQEKEHSISLWDSQIKVLKRTLGI